MPQDAKDNYAYDWTKYKKSTGPTFDRNEMVQNVTVEKGQTAYLPCVILNQEHFTISWLRKNRHMNIITVGEHRFIQDERYSLPHYKGPSDWTLKIANVKLADGGIYECQIGTTPKTGRNISLFIAATRNAHVAPSKSGTMSRTSHSSTSSLLHLLCGLLIANFTYKIRLKDVSLFH
ncbi:hypothetical protein RvY_08200-2 [Ramazzottius varieornatus]|uniref:Ig-like domain-containing protein n=1 Tax=Ramazzottius varieornatus TaxID=947166 RepID=A0A1D1V7R3_RAMVA|nr:hypothetical protein RvY_08200-2 [Ramazzottius varieornatus]